MKTYIPAAVLALSVACACTPVHATVTLIEHMFEFSGAAEPQGPGPWLTTTIDDRGTPGSVNITLGNVNLVANEFVSKWYLNVADRFEPDLLDFTASSTIGTFVLPSIETETDGFKAAGSGYFDIMFDFATGGGSGARFGAGESLILTVHDAGAGTLVASDFDVQCSAVKAKAKNVRIKETAQERLAQGGFPAAAHVQGIGIDGAMSGWVSTPEPAPLGLLGLGSLLLMVRRR